MDWTNFTRMLGFDEPTSLLDPKAYSDAEIEGDLIELELKQQHAENMVGKKGEAYNHKLDEAAEADEWQVEDKLDEADSIEREQEDWQDEWRELRKYERLVKSVKSFRRRVNASDPDLNVTDWMEQAEESQIRSELERALTDHMRSSKQVDEVLQMFTNTRQVGRKQSGSTARDLSKHRERMEARQQASQDGRTATDDDEETDDERQVRRTKRSDD